MHTVFGAAAGAGDDPDPVTLGDQSVYEKFAGRSYSSPRKLMKISRYSNQTYGDLTRQ